MEGRFIVFEGIDGSGKTTQARLLGDALVSRGRRVHLTCEPTNGPVGSVLRQFLQKRLEFDSRSLPYLFAADRSDHIFNQRNGVEAALRRGVDVICDRYILSTFAYQGDLASFELLESLNRAFPLPDITFFLEVDPERGMADKARQSTYTDVYETAEKQQHIARRFGQALLRLEQAHNVVRLDSRTLGLAGCAQAVLGHTLPLLDGR